MVQHDPGKLVLWGKTLFAVEIIYLVSICLAKLAILAIYARIFTSRITLSIVYVTGCIVAAAWIGCTIANFLQVSCRLVNDLLSLLNLWYHSARRSIVYSTNPTQNSANALTFSPTFATSPSQAWSQISLYSSYQYRQFGISSYLDHRK